MERKAGSACDAAKILVEGEDGYAAQGKRFGFHPHGTINEDQPRFLRMTFKSPFETPAEK